MLTVKSSAVTLLSLMGASYTQAESHHGVQRQLFLDPQCPDFGYCCNAPESRRNLRKKFIDAMEQPQASRALALNNGQCETAYALWNPNNDQEHCFKNEGFDKPERWGWRLEIDATKTTTTTYEVWAAAGQCLISNGELVGSFSITYNPSTKVCSGTFTANLAHGINTMHFYCGVTEYPQKNGADTVANGQFPCNDGGLGLATSHTCSVNVNPGGQAVIHAIAHLDACGTGGSVDPKDPEDPPEDPPADYCGEKLNCVTPTEFCEGSGLELCGDSCCNGDLEIQFKVDEQCEALGAQFCPKTCDPDVFGDPHFRTWHHAHEFEYHGECDLVFMKAPALDMDIHVRTTIRYDYSYVSQAAVRIGKEIFEVASWGEYQLDGMSSVDLPAFIGGYPITRKQMAHKENLKVNFVIHLDQDQDISITSYKDYVAVRIENGTIDLYQGASGIMGDYETGSMFMRDGTINEDPEVFAPEWQVRPEVDGILFAGDRAPVYPQKCVLPAANAISARARKLGEASVSKQQAEAACSRKTGNDKAACIKDVIKTQDLDVADSY